MKTTVKRITALFLILLLTASLLASCKSGGEEETVTEVDGIPVFDQYKSRKVDLGLSEDEVIYDIIEIDGMLRATIGVLDPNYDPEHPEEYLGLPYPTEYRWYSLDYVEDTSKREKTLSYYEITFTADPSVEFALGGEFYEDEYGKGVQYHFYSDEGPQEGFLLSPELGIDDPSTKACTYGSMAHIMLYEGVPFASFHYGVLHGDGITYRSEWAGAEHLYVNDRFLNTKKWTPGDPKYTYHGLIGIKGVPYALLEINEKGCLVPLTPETTELPLKGIEIDGCPTGGAFTDGRFGYFMSGTELWRTDGKESKCIVDLVPYGVSLTSMVRSVRSISDGRILISVDGKLIELSELVGSEEPITICDIGVIDYYEGLGELEDLSLTVSKYNDQADNAFFRVMEYEDVADLNLALLTGDIDMVITPNQFTLNNYIKQGLLAPLEEVVPALFEKDVLIESVVDATRVDGTCYYLPLNFEICGKSITDPSLLKEGKLFENRLEYYDFVVQNDYEYFKSNTPRQILTDFSRDLDEWIDWESNTAHFDDGTFAALLEFCRQGSAQDEITEYWSTKTPLANDWGRDWKSKSFILKDSVESYRFTDVKKALDYQKTLPVTEGVGGPTTWVQVDFPMPSRVHNGYEIFAHNLYAVVDHEDTKAAAADLLQWLILEDVEEEFPEKQTTPFLATGWDGFSINKDETDRYLRRLIDGYVDPEEEVAKIKPEVAKEFPNTVYHIRYNVQNYDMRCGQEQYEITWSYINNADHLRYHDSEIHKVIVNEAASFFSGSITAKQAADYVQNRISLYLAEQS